MKTIYYSFAIIITTIFINIKINAQVIRTIAGNHIEGHTGDGGIAVNASIGVIGGIVSDANGNIYVSDNSNYVVRKITKEGNITTIAGISNHLGYTGDGGLAINAKLFAPCGLAIDNIGNLYIADNGNSAIRKIDTLGIITTVVGIGSWGFTGDGGSATNARINGGMAITFDRMGNMYIADGNLRIRKVDRLGIISTIAGGTYGYAGDGGPATSASLVSPQGIAIDTFNNIYISDFSNNVIRKINASGIISTFAGTHIAGYNGDGDLAINSKIDAPRGIIIDGYGNLIFADQGNNRVRMIDKNGIITTIAGFGIDGSYGDGGRPRNAMVNNPSDLFINCKGNMLIADAGNYLVREILYNGNTDIVAEPGTTICNGASIVLSVNTNNAFYGVKYQWTINGLNVGTDTSVFVNNTYNNRDIVNCIITDPYMGYVLDSAVGTGITVNPYVTPTINVFSSIGDTVCAGTLINYYANYSFGGLYPTFLWKVNGITSGTDSTFNYAPANSDIITCEIHSNGLCLLIDTAISANINMTVNADVTPSVSIASSTGTVLMADVPVTFNAAVSYGGSSPTYQWVINSVSMPGATNATYSVLSLNAGDTVTCLATSNSACATITNVMSNEIIVIPSLGVKSSNVENDNFIIYPNPNNGNFTLYSTMKTEIKYFINYKVTDMIGNLVYQGALPIENNTINTQVNLNNTLSTGMYLFLINEPELRYVMPFVVKK